MDIDPILQNVGRVAGSWWKGAQDTVQDFHSTIAKALPGKGYEQAQVFLNNRGLHQNEVLKDADQGTSDGAKELEIWRQNPTWVDEKPVMEVLVPDGALCQLKSTFKVGLPPLTVFNILSDPENKRVFKDIQEVRHRKVLEDYGDRQVIELEQAAIWRFLWLSGTLSVFVRVDQNRSTLSLNYKLGKQGFMKRFEGSWHIEPLSIDADEGINGGRVASLVQLQQIVEPALIPPPPISWYVRGITARTVEKLLSDLQAEGKRLREDSHGNTTSTKLIADANVESKKQMGSVLHRCGMLPLRACGSSWRSQRKRWRYINA